MTGCAICLHTVPPGQRVHPRCAEDLFGTPHLPVLALGQERLQELGVEMIAVGHGSISGTQPKVLVELSEDGQRLEVAIGRSGTYILKPQAREFPHLPENEHATMRLAQRVGIEVAPCGLLELPGGGLSYIVRRFDRTGAARRKLRQEDFCQLAGKMSDDKYQGSAELCIRLLQKHATDPVAAVARFFQILLFSYLSGNGDMHLKNHSLLTDERDETRLSPAYDLVCTALVIPGDQMALSVRGKKDKIRWRYWAELAHYGGLPEERAEEIRCTLSTALRQHAGDLLLASALDAQAQEQYLKILAQREESLLV